MKDLLDRLSKAIGEMSNPAAETAPAEDEAVEMSMEDFVGYVTDQVEKAAADSPEIRAARLSHLLEQVEVAKNFQGPTPGKVNVKAFKDRDQTTPTPPKNVTAPQNASAGSNFTAGAPSAPAGKPTTPSGGQLPPMTAGGSGFATPAAATFAKSMDDLKAAIAGLSADDAGDPPAGDPPGDKPPVGEPPAAKTVTKAADPLWPMDMNTPFGRGETKDDQVPEWGMDKDHPAATLPAADQAPAE